MHSLFWRSLAVRSCRRCRRAAGNHTTGECWLKVCTAGCGASSTPAGCGCRRAQDACMRPTPCRQPACEAEQPGCPAANPVHSPRTPSLQYQKGWDNNPDRAATNLVVNRRGDYPPGARRWAGGRAGAQSCRAQCVVRRAARDVQRRRQRQQLSPTLSPRRQRCACSRLPRATRRVPGGAQDGAGACAVDGGRHPGGEALTDPALRVTL